MYFCLLEDAHKYESRCNTDRKPSTMARHRTERTAIRPGPRGLCSARSHNPGPRPQAPWPPPRVFDASGNGRAAAVAFVGLPCRWPVDFSWAAVLRSLGAGLTYHTGLALEDNSHGALQFACFSYKGQFDVVLAFIVVQDALSLRIINALIYCSYQI